MPHPLQFVLLLLVGRVGRLQQEVIEYLREENRVLRELHGKRRLRFTDAQRRRLARKAQPLGRRRLEGVASLVTPDTLLRWYRELVARKYDGGARPGPGRPRVSTETVEAVLRFARENPTWGYVRIRDAVAGVGLVLSKSTVRRILLEHGLDPAPKRREGTSWSEFLRAHRESLHAADFFTVEVLTWCGLVRYHVFFVLTLATRRVEVAGIRREPDGAWMQQVGRNLTDAVSGLLAPGSRLILDRDPLYTRRFRELLAGSGVKVVRLPPKSPNLNAYAERFVRSIKEECLSRLILLGEGHLRRVVHEYVAHFNGERHHQGLDGRLIDPDETSGRTRGGIVCRERLGGLLRYYHRAA